MPLNKEVDKIVNDIYTKAFSKGTEGTIKNKDLKKDIKMFDDKIMELFEEAMLEVIGDYEKMVVKFPGSGRDMSNFSQAVIKNVIKNEQQKRLEQILTKQ